MIGQFDREAGRQRRLARASVGLCGGALAALLLYFAAEQALRPWRARHHAALQGVMAAHAAAVGQLGSALAVLAATAAVLFFREDGPGGPEAGWRNLLAFSSTAALFACGFWATAGARRGVGRTVLCWRQGCAAGRSAVGAHGLAAAARAGVAAAPHAGADAPLLPPPFPQCSRSGSAITTTSQPAGACSGCRWCPG